MRVHSCLASPFNSSETLILAGASTDRRVRESLTASGAINRLLRRTAATILAAYRSFGSDPEVLMFAKSTRIPSLTILSMVALAACSREASQPKTPLAQAQPAAAAQSVADPLPAAARSALDQGNAEYRAGKFDAALASYRAAAKAAPSEAAPYFGVLMVAQKLGNKPLADSASQAIAERNGDRQMLTDSSMRALHATGQPK